MTHYTHKEVEEKWISRWEESGIYNSEPDLDKESFFVNYPYSYMNMFPHVGHAFTMMRVDIYSRYKRMKGSNVLFPFAFHCTGTPIVAAANRVKEGEETILKQLRGVGIPEDIIMNFKDPVFWTEFFPREWEKDVRRLGLGIDWRRKFITTSLNPYYDKFIQWQFLKLKEMGYARLGTHPVIWCPKDSMPVGDHDRVSGEGQTPQEFVILKLSMGSEFLVAATLRPETVFGQTNIWADPNVTYERASVDGEVWVASKECFAKLALQGFAVQKMADIPGRELMGKMVQAPMVDYKVPVLPSSFCDPKKGTGIVTSVPSDAPDDYQGLVDLQHDERECARLGIDWQMVKLIKPIPIIKSVGWGDLPAQEICRQLGIRNQKERGKLNEAKEEIYKSGFYTGVMKENCGEFSGMPVDDAKKNIKKKLIESGQAGIMWETSGNVVCRCLTPSVVKLVSDQWFLAYGDEGWKAKTHEAIENMRFSPESVRTQFHNVVDWLNDWACTREHGLGTTLPWDDKWKIESLSDSTIYMAYYTIAHYLEQDRKIPANRVDGALYDYVFLGKGDAGSVAATCGVDAAYIEKMRSEFLYWYPVDFRNSGKDLVQNHLTFSIFNHVAIFEEAHWPRMFGVNGWLMISGEKMSKSKGNFLLLREALDRYGADVSRFTLAMGGEGLDDPNFDETIADNTGKRIEQWMNFARANYGKGRTESGELEKWFSSQIDRAIRTTDSAMHDTMFRSAIKHGYFDLQTAYKWYAKRCTDKMNSEILKRYIEVQTKLLAPFIPHTCEEVWEIIRMNGSVVTANYPEPAADEPDYLSEAKERFLVNTLDDIASVLKIVKTKPSTVYIYTAARWKYEVHKEIRSILSSGIDPKGVVPHLGKREEFRAHMKKIANFAPKFSQDFIRVDEEGRRHICAEFNEYEFLLSNVSYLSREIGLDVRVMHEDDSGLHDPAGKAKASMPGRVGIYVE